MVSAWMEMGDRDRATSRGAQDQPLACEFMRWEIAPLAVGVKDDLAKWVLPAMVTTCINTRWLLGHPAVLLRPERPPA